MSMDEITRVLMSPGEGVDIEIEELPEDAELPAAAVYDNTGYIGEQQFDVYVLPGTPVLGRAFVLHAFLTELAEEMEGADA
jgi:molybdopterin-biosynthesis enzyme MoeA-like protein